MVDLWERAAPLATRTLKPDHRKVLEVESGIDPAVITARGYYSLERKSVFDLVQLEVIDAGVLKADSWLAIPTHRPDGVKHGEIIRRFGSSVSSKMKYVWPTGQRNAIDVLPSTRSKLMDTSIPIIITEGIKKGDALYSAALREGFDCVVLSLNGCWGWKARTEGGSITVQDFQDIPLEERKVYVISDSDYRTNDDVAAGWNGCATYLSSKTGAHRVFMVVVPQDGLDKVGADDYLSTGHSLVELLSYATTPRQVVLDTIPERIPLRVKTARQVIDEAAKGIPHLMTPILPEQSLVVVAGHSATYKTWHMMNVALDGAFGMPWTEHPTITTERTFKTMYVNKEMGGVILGQRFKLLAQNPKYKDHADIDKVIDERIFVVDDASLDLVTRAGQERLEEAILDMGVQLVVLDSLSMCWTGDENSASEVGRFYSQLRELCEMTGVTIVIIHHLLKPQGTRKKDHVMFSVRGSGQILQQADSALIFASAIETGDSDEAKEVNIKHAKSRTEMELPAWLTRVSRNEGKFVNIVTIGNVTEITAKEYAASPGDPEKLEAWVVAELASMPAMRPRGSGLRSTQLIKLLQAAWPVESKNPPSPSTLRRRLDAMVESGDMEMVNANKRLGDLFRLTDDPAPEKQLGEVDEKDKEPEAT